MTDIESVLIVDDERDLALTLKEYLERKGHRCLIAETGAEALRALRATPVALLLLDLRLSDMDGLEVMREALNLEPHPEVLVMTGHASAESAMAAIEGSSAGYVLKPIQLARLAGIVQRVVERRRLARDNARLEAEMGQRLREMEAILEISKASSSTLDLREGLRRVCRELTRLIGADTGAVYLHDPVSDQLTPQAGYHVPPDLLPTLLATPLPFKEQGFHGAVWTQRLPVASDDVGADARFSHDLFRLFPHQSGLVLPLILDSCVAGAFYLVWWSERRLLTDRELALMENVAAQATTLLRNARLFEQAERERRRLDALYEVSRRLAAARDSKGVLARIVDEATNLLSVEAAGIRLMDGDDLVLAARTVSAAPLMVRPRIKVGESLSGRVVASGEPLLIDNLAEDDRILPEHKVGVLEHGFKSFLGVPLRLHGRAIGGLNLYSKHRRHFSPDEVSLLSALADQASLAIYKAQLLTDAEEGRAVVERLSSFAVAMQSSWDRGERLRTFASGAHQVVGFDRVNVLLLTADGAGLELLTTSGEHGELPPATLPLSPEAGSFYEVLRTRQTLTVLDEADLRAQPPLAAAYRSHPAFRASRFILAPLIVGERVIGVASADNKPTRRPIRPASVGWFSLLCQHLAMALEESRLHAETQAREREATQLYEITSLLASSLDAGWLLDHISERAVDLLQCDAFGIHMYDKARGGFALHSALNLPAELKNNLVLKAGEGLVGRAAESRKPAWTRDCLTDPSLAYPPAADSLIRSKSPRAYLAVPVVIRGEVLGVLMSYFFEPHDFSESDVRLLSTLADHAGIAMDNARHYEQERQVNQMKSDFVSFVTHQLRTPLAGIKWMLELAAQEPELPAEAGSYVRDAQIAAQRLIGLVNDLLDVSRLERGKLQISPQAVALGAVTRSVLEETALLVAAKGHRLDMAGCADGPLVTADPQLLRQVVLNLVSNAIKYTPDGGKVEIAICEADGEARWQIRDSGIGIPTAAQPRLFEKFYRADNVATFETEGTGLGLYLVRLILDQLGGRVWCESVEGEGSVFFLALPLHESTP